jgi:hypothetical protein
MSIKYLNLELYAFRCHQIGEENKLSTTIWDKLTISKNQDGKYLNFFFLFVD